MSFSSAQWTIPELCVWIVTGRKEAVNALSREARESLELAEIIHPGAYAARDEVVEAAQADSIRITCNGQRNFHGTISSRRMLTPDFWKYAEIEDRGGWCIARRIDQPTADNEFHDLLVDSDRAKVLWSPAETPRKESDPAPASEDSPVPREFVAWANIEHASGRLITESGATEAMTVGMGKAPGRNELRRWLATLDASWRAVRGTPPPKS